MNFKRNLRNISFYVVLGIILIIVGILIYRLNKNKIVQVLPQPVLVSSPLPSVIFAKVTRVIDGDTIVIDTGAHVRYIGMNTPEVESSECFASEAGDINRNLVLGKTVKLEKDISDMDKYGRLLRYVYIVHPELDSGSILVNNELVKTGAARIMPISPDTKYKNDFLESQNYAKENGLGLWKKCR